MLRIYGNPFSHTIRTYWAAGELDIPFENIEIDCHGQQRSASYLKVNPNGLVPTIDDDGFILWESMGINLYLSKKAGRLYPTDLIGEASTWMWSFWALTEVDRPVRDWALHAHILPPQERSMTVAADAISNLEAPFNVLNSTLGKQPFLVSSVFTIADLNVASVLYWARRMDLSIFPVLQDWLHTCWNRPAARSVRSLRE